MFIENITVTVNKTLQLYINANAIKSRLLSTAVTKTSQEQNLIF